jgi:hypothetical protein
MVRRVFMLLRLLQVALTSNFGQFFRHFSRSPSSISACQQTHNATQELAQTDRESGITFRRKRHLRSFGTEDDVIESASSG